MGYQLSSFQYSPAAERTLDGPWRADQQVGETESNLHRLTIANINRYLVRMLPPSFYLQPRSSLPLDNYTVTVPDIAVMAGTMEEHLGRKFGEAMLVIEVAFESLHHDRTTKRDLYAKAGIPEYWIVNLRNASIELHRKPHPNAPRYTQEEILRRGDALSSPFGGANIPVSQLFLESRP